MNSKIDRNNPIVIIINEQENKSINNFSGLISIGNGQSRVSNECFTCKGTSIILREIQEGECSSVLEGFNKEPESLTLFDFLNPPPAQTTLFPGLI